jgi:hypothetical protein
MDIYVVGIGALIFGFILGRASSPMKSKMETPQIIDIKPTRELTKEAEDNINSLMRQGNKIEALRYIREALGIGLKEAKDLADLAFEQRNFDIRSIVEYTRLKTEALKAAELLDENLK